LLMTWIDRLAGDMVVRGTRAQGRICPWHASRSLACSKCERSDHIVSTSGPGTDLLYLVEDSRPVATIIIPNDADECTITAARWLREYLCKVSGAELDIVAESEAPSGTRVSVGHTLLARKAGIGAGDLKWDGCRLAATDGVLYLLGRDHARKLSNPFEGTKQEHPGALEARLALSHSLRGARGTCRAVVVFLERFCGVRWFLPGPEGEHVPKSRDVAVPAVLHETNVPAFAFSDARFPYGENTPGALANNFRMGLAALTGGATYYWMAPASEYFEDHPEYFALINGQRTKNGNHLCTSNPEVRQLLLQAMRDQFDLGCELMILGQEDGYLRCECPECEKLDNYRWDPDTRDWYDFFLSDDGQRATPCERLFLTQKWVIDELQKSHPDKKVLLHCYAPTAWPSEKIKQWGKNVYVELAHYDPEMIEAWKGKAGAFTGYLYWFDNQLPMGMDVHVTPREVAAKIRYLHENGFIGLYQLVETNWGLQGPVFYVLGKLMGDPYLDPDALVEEYCRGVFGEVAATMIEFFNVLYDRHENLLTQDQKITVATHPSALSTADLFLLYYPPEHLRKLENALCRAEGEAENERICGWLRLTRDHLDYVTLVTHMLIAYRAWQVDATEAHWSILKRKVENFEAYRMRIITYPQEYASAWFPGHDTFCNFLTADGQRENVYYIPWERRKPELMEKGIRGMAIGYWGPSPGYNCIKEPLTLDFSKEYKEEWLSESLV